MDTERPRTGASPVTGLLQRWRGGDPAALDELFPLVYEELRRLAGHFMRGERASHTLQATALVHEAFLRLVDMKVSWQDRAHFLSVAARAMRRILVDHARAKGSARRGGGAPALSLDEALIVDAGPRPAIIRMDEALGRLAGLDARKGQVVELHYFGGLTQDEIAEVLAVSTSTVERELRQARAWLHREMAGPP